MTAQHAYKRLRLTLVLLLLIATQPISVPLHAASPAELTTRFTYNPNGTVKTRTDAASVVTTYDYDALSRLRAIHYPGNSAITFSYDSIGQRTEMKDSLGTSHYEYDIHGRLTSITDPNGHTVKYAYDPRGLLTKLAYPDGSVTTYTWDANGRVVTVQDTTGPIHYEYDRAGKVTRRTLPNGVTTHYQYDQASRLTAIRHANQGGAALLQFTYTFDALGNRTQMTRAAAGSAPQATRYAYDAVSQLVRVVYPNGEDVTYQYDATGNRVTMISSTQSTTRYRYNSLGQLARLDGPGGSVHFRYDPNGNLAERIDSTGQAVRYAWDYENRLVAVDEGTTTVRFGYDGDGRRLTKIINGHKIEYVQHGTLLPEVLLQTASGQTTRLLLGLPHIGEASSQGVLFYLEDGLGSVVGVTDASGSLRNTFEYDAFGTQRGVPAPSPSIGFVGSQLDVETSLVFLRARYYDPAVGRFISADPYRPSLDNPQTLSRYVYVGNNPINFIDPLGLQGGPPPPPPWYLWDNRLNSMNWSMTAYQLIPHSFYVTNNPGSSANLSDLSHEWMYRSDYDIYPSTWTQRDYASSPAWVRDRWFNREHPGTTGYRERTGWFPWEWSSRGQINFYNSIDHENPPSTDFAGVFGPPGMGLLVNLPFPFSIPGKDSLIILGLEDLNIPAFAIHFIADWLPYKVKQLLSSRHSSHLDSQDRGWDDKNYLPFPPDNGGGGVGGVSLDRAAEVIGDLRDIGGAAYDPITGQVVLIGRKDVNLPPMSLDDLAVAIRAVYAGENPGVTMVPVDPSGQILTQRVEYFGQTEYTRFGQVMFDADRYLKSLAAGKDSLTGARLTPRVPGFQSELDLALNLQTTVPWHRNWFVPGEIVLRQAADGQSMVFDRATIKVESRFIQFQPDGTHVDIPGSSLVTDQFTRFLTDHYDAFTVQKPELAELVRLAKVVGVIKWLRDRNIPIDRSWMADYQIKATATPTTTPGVLAQKSTPGGAFTIRSFGGVDFSTGNTYIADHAGEAQALRNQALAARPSDTPIRWEFTQDGKPFTAVALTLAPSLIVGGYTTAVVDMDVPVAGGLAASFTRSYNSLDLTAKELGPSWSFMPYTLSFQEIHKPVSETSYTVEKQVMLHAGSQRVRFTGPYHNEQNPDQMLLLPEKHLGSYRDILLQPDGYILRRIDGLNVCFNLEGRLQAIEDLNGNRVSYRYDDQGQLVAIADAEGRGLQLAYTADGHLADLRASDGHERRYTYNTSGHLIGVSDEQGTRLVGYAYGVDGRLIQTTDRTGQVLPEMSYDGLGRVTSIRSAQGYTSNLQYGRQANTVVSTDSAGRTFTRQYDDQNRLVNETDPGGNSTTFQYDQSDHLTQISDPAGNTTTLRYDPQGLLSEAISPLGDHLHLLNYNSYDLPEAVIDQAGRLALFEYDEQGHVTEVKTGLQVTSLSPDGSFSYEEIDPLTTAYEYDSVGNLVAGRDPSGATTRFTYDTVGNLVSAQMPDGGEVAQTFDTRSQLTTMTDPTGYRVVFDYDPQGQLATITTPAGVTEYHYADGRLTAITDARGNTITYDYNQAGLLQTVTELGDGVTSYDYDAAGNLVAVTDALGKRSRYEYDAVGRLSATTRLYVPDAEDHPVSTAESQPSAASGPMAWLAALTREVIDIGAIALTMLIIITGRLIAGQQKWKNKRRTRRR